MRHTRHAWAAALFLLFLFAFANPVSAYAADPPVTVGLSAVVSPAATPNAVAYEVEFTAIISASSTQAQNVEVCFFVVGNPVDRICPLPLNRNGLRYYQTGVFPRGTFEVEVNVTNSGDGEFIASDRVRFEVP